MATRPNVPSDDFTSRPEEVTYAYDVASRNYRAYADSSPRSIFELDGACAFADREIWALIDGELVALRASGTRRIRVLDAVCGPGTWLIRCVLRARKLGFTIIEGVDFDISPEMIIIACGVALEVSGGRSAFAAAITDIGYSGFGCAPPFVG